MVTIYQRSLRLAGRCVGLGLLWGCCAHGELLVDFSREVLPILSDRCFHCHGPDAAERKAGLRLDTRDGLFMPVDGRAGWQVVTPGDPARSELMARIQSRDPDEAMPPPDSNKKPLSAAEQDTLKRWIEQGAVWAPHWAFVPPEKGPPEVLARVPHPVDAFLHEKLTAVGMNPNPRAEPSAQLRRLSLDLTGLPPSPELVRTFEQSPTDAEYLRIVDTLLASESYGEHMARYWLDAARYADTHGFHLDNYREIWPYRDWVIQAFNENKPFDVFTIEQLAGDLLEHPTQDQLVASGFVRMHPTTAEGGLIEAEYHTLYVADRVDTASTIWLGMAANCAACHDHKYDPLTQKEFYQLFAFFNSTSEQVSDQNIKNPGPVISVPSLAQKLRLHEIASRLSEIDQRFSAPDPLMDAEQVSWERAATESLRADVSTFELGTWRVLGPFPVPEGESGAAFYRDFGPEKVGAVAQEFEGGMVWTSHEGLVDGAIFALPSVVGVHYFHREIIAHRSLNLPVAFGSDDAIRVFLNGVLVHEKNIARAVTPGEDKLTLPLREGRNEVLVKVINTGGAGGFASDVFQDRAIEVEDEVWVDEEYDLGGEARADVPGTSGKQWEGITITSEQGPVYSGRLSRRQKARGRPQHFFSHSPRPLVVAEGDALYAYVFIDPQDPPKTIMLQYHSSGWNHRAYWGDDTIEWGRGPQDNPAHRRIGSLPEAGGWVRLEVPVSALGMPSGVSLNGMAFTQTDGTVYWDQAGIRRSVNNAEALKWLAVAPDERTPDMLAGLRTYYRARHHEAFTVLHKERQTLAKEKEGMSASFATTLIAKELPTPKKAFVLERGEYDKPREEVTRAVPAFLHAWPDGAPLNRLGLARWLVAPQNPLTARVTVNRFWQQVFGIGLVATSEDFGVQGERPIHQALLDHLAHDFVANGWDVKAFMRHLVTSEAYRRSAVSSPEQIAADPQNRLLARGPRFRLDAEVLRDQALALSGLLVPEIGGPSVKPYQPPGLWEVVGYTSSNTVRFQQDSGDKLHRRSMYTFWKRTSPPPSMTIFDAPSRETCTVIRERTNTPLAALVTLNDVQYVEAARQLAARVLREGGGDDAGRVQWAMRLVTARIPSDPEITELLALLHDHRAHYAAHPNEAAALVAVGDHPRDPALDPIELAAWTLIANLLLNLDETLNKG